MVVFVCVLLFPLAIGIIGGIFGLIGGVIGGFVGLVGAIFGIIFGMIGVSIVSWTLAVNEFPYALYLMPLYMVYVAGLLGIKAARLNSVRR